MNYCTPITSNPKQRKRLSKFSEAKIIAKAAKVTLRSSNVGDIDLLSSRLASCVLSKNLTSTYVQALQALIQRNNGKIAPITYSGAYLERFKKIFFSFLSHGLAKKNLVFRYPSYTSACSELLIVLPNMERVLISGLFFTRFHCNGPLCDIIYEATGGCYNKQNILTQLREINIKPEDTTARFLIALIILASEQRLPSWFQTYYNDAKKFYNSRKETVESKAINSFCNSVARLEETVYTLKKDITTIKRNNKHLKEENSKLTKICTALSRGEFKATKKKCKSLRI